MTATDELRRLLDELGIEWDGESYKDSTFWNDDANLAIASDDRDGLLWVSQRLTPEQAIAVTLGAETCNVAESAELREQNADLRVELADMFSWLVDYITPEQAQAWADRLERVGVTVDWGWRA